MCVYRKPFMRETRPRRFIFLACVCFHGPTKQSRQERHELLLL